MPAGKEAAEKPKRKNSRKKADVKVIKLEKTSNEKARPVKVYNPDDVVFSLDIGTRTIVGIAGVQENEVFKVIASETLEHKNRAMLDGQIHDIEQVALLASEVKKRMEKQLGFELKKVAIAAAGRVLKTSQVKVELEIDQSLEIDQELIGSLEIEGIQKAQEKLEQEISEEEKTQFYCVGYSIINYYLNGFVISKLTGHKGKKVGVDILATFLPHIVVDSLYTVMNKIGLEVSSLTLEPIAAINVTIPKDLRLLNLALVDIGAGTSDIALTRDGSVVAYAMVSTAGDEITERISQYYLVDFNTAEKIKISLSSGHDSIAYTDILGSRKVTTYEELNQVIEPAVELLAQTISQKILDYNHKAPNAVFLIGGGSQVNGLTQKIAGFLKLSNERVAVRRRDIIQNIKFGGRKLSGPEAITPIGIAVTAVMQQGRDFLSVTLNGKKIKLFNSKKLTVADSLILLGFNPGQLIGRTGKSLTFELNGDKRTIRGEHGKVAEIFINGKQSSLDAVINLGEDIVVKPATDGRNAVASVKDVAGDLAAGSITLNGEKVDIGTKVYINGSRVGLDTAINEGDSVNIIGHMSVESLLDAYGSGAGEPVILVNDRETEKDYLLRDGDAVEFIQKQTTQAVEEAAAQAEESIPAINNIGVRPFDSNSFTVLVNGSQVTLSGDKSKYIFVDIFNFIDFDITRPQGNIVLRLNGFPAAFTDEIRHGDIIDIYWDKK